MRSRYRIAPAGLGVQIRFGLAAMSPMHASGRPSIGLDVIPKDLMNLRAKCAVVIGEMYASFHPRLGTLHFTLAIVFFPLGAPQAQPVPSRIATPMSVSAPAIAPTPAAAAPRDLGSCITGSR